VRRGRGHTAQRLLPDSGDHDDETHLLLWSHIYSVIPRFNSPSLTSSLKVRAHFESFTYAALRVERKGLTHLFHLDAPGHILTLPEESIHAHLQQTKEEG